MNSMASFNASASIQPIISIQLPEIKEEEKIVSAINPKPVIEPVIKIEEFSNTL